MTTSIRAQVLIDGDPKGLRTALAESEADLLKLDQAGKKVDILATAIQNAKDARAEFTRTRDAAQLLDEQLALAKGAGAGKEAIKLLQAELKDANRELAAAEKAWDKSREKLDLARSAAAAAGVDTRNLATEQARLKTETEAAAEAVKRNAQAIDDARRVAAEKLAADRAAAAEEQRLAQIVEANTNRQKLAARELLDAEKRTYAEAEASARRAATAREEEARATEAFSARTKKALADSFSAVGIRGSEAIQAEILSIQQSLMKLGASAKVSGDDFDRAFAEAKTRIAALEAEMNGTAPAMNRMEAGARSLKGEFAAMAGQFVGLAVAMQAGKDFIAANAGAESLVRTLTQLTGSATAAAAEMEYIRAASNRLGVDVREAAKSYTQLLAATKDTALEGAGAKQVFEAVAGAMAALGKSSSETNNALMAVNQMASKGTVQMEELKGQLGEALPGALKAAAAGAGLTVAELSKMVETGNVLAEDLLPALAKGLTEMYGVGKAENDTFVANFARMKNSVSDAFQVIGDSGVFKALSEGIGEAAQDVAVLTVGFEAAAKKIGVMAAAISSGDFGLSGFSERAKLALGEIDLQTEQSLLKIKNSSKSVAAAMDESGKAAEAAGKKANAASGDWLKIENAYSEVEKASSKQISTLKTLADAHDAGGAAMKAFADAFGTEVEKLDAATNAAKEHEASLRKIADQVRADLEISKSRMAALEQERGADGKLSESKEKLREELQKTIVAKAAEADKTAQAAAAAHSAVLQAQAAQSVYADHSKQVYALRDAWQAAQVEYERLSALNAKGVNVAKELQAADEARAKALLLYRDALADATAAAERRTAAERAGASLQQGALQNDLYRANTILEVAKQRGNEKDIAEAQIAVWRIELQINEALAQGARLEAEAMLLVAKAKRAELEASGPLTDAKKAELALMDANIKAKQLEAEKYDLVAERMRAMASDTNELKSGFGELGEAGANAAQLVGDSWDSAAARVKKAGSVIQSAKADGSMNADGTVNRNVFTSSSENYKIGVQNGLSDEEAKVFADKYGYYVEKANAEARSLPSIGTVEGLRDQYVNLHKYYLQQALEYAKTHTNAQTTAQAKENVKDFYASGRTVTVNLNINGKTTPVRVIDQNAADDLVRALRDAEGALK